MARALLAACWLLVACVEDVSTGRRCAENDCGGPAKPHAIDGSVVAENGALKVHVEDVASMTIEIVTLRCAGDCADVQAVARGGNPPYAFEWEDGSTDAERHICVDAGAQFSVNATDTAIEDDEFHYDAHTAKAEVSVEVLDCETPGEPGDICLENASFEGAPGVNEYTGGFKAAPWATCEGTADVWNETQSWTTDFGAPAAIDGSTYLALYETSIANVITVREAVSQPLCAPLTAGTQYSFEVDLAFRTEGAYAATTAGSLEVWAGSAACGADQLLWTSPVAGRDWQTACVTFTAEQPFEHILFRAAASTGTGIFVDRIVPVARCGE